MILSKTCDYGVRASLYVASQSHRKFVPIREISHQLNISFHFLTKILQILTQNNIMKSYRGPNGGVAFKKSPAKITLMDIVLAIDGQELFTKCLLGLERCNDNRPCPLHMNWKKIRSELKNLFNSTTLEVMAKKIKQDGFRISELLIENPVQ